MPIILVLLLTASCARLPWPEPPFGLGARESVALTAAALLLPLGATAVLARWAAATVRAAPHRRGEVAVLYTRFRRLLGFAVLAAAAVAVAGLGWGWTVWNRFTVVLHGEPVLAPLAELLVPAPYILTLFTAWLLHYDAEKAFHDASADGGRPFWSRGGHFLFNLRPFAFLILLPAVLFASQQSFLRLAPETADHWLAQLLAVAIVPALFVLLPLLVKPALGLVPLPPGPARDRFTALARKLNFRYTDLLLWPTRGGVANAMVVGIIPQARYVVFTDKLLDCLDPDEADAVFGHEVGHVKHGHIVYYAGFFMLSAAVTAAGVAAGLNAAAAAGLIDLRAWDGWLAIPPLVVLAGYVFVVFGFLSRKCERQADLFGCRVAGSAAMVRALERVAVLNGMDLAAPTDRPTRRRWRAAWALVRAWQHGSIPERVSYLLAAADDPATVRAFQRRVFLLRCGLMLALVAAMVGIGCWAGWREVVRVM